MTNASLYKLVFIISCLFMVIILDCAMKMAAPGSLKGAATEEHACQFPFRAGWGDALSV